MAKKILLIDDDEVFSKTVSERLRSAGYEVAYSRNGEDGLRALEKDAPDLILLDIMMPGLNGINFLKKIHHKSGSPLVPVLIFSNSTDMMNIGESVALGVKGYIVKSEESLDGIVRNVEITLAHASDSKEKTETPS